jgi:hypothetical protein
MQFSDTPTALMQAFAHTGIDLQAYQKPLFLDQFERTRHKALVSVAYKRLASLHLDSEGDKYETHQTENSPKKEKKEQAKEYEEISLEPIPSAYQPSWKKYGHVVERLASPN